jgi:hypothetical protein
VNVHIKPLRTKFLLNNIQQFSSYLTGSTSTFRYKKQPVNIALGIYCGNHTKYTNTLCVQNAEFWCDKAGGRCSEHCVLKGQYEIHSIIIFLLWNLSEVMDVEPAVHGNSRCLPICSDRPTSYYIVVYEIKFMFD